MKEVDHGNFSRRSSYQLIEAFLKADKDRPDWKWLKENGYSDLVGSELRELEGTIDDLILFSRDVRFRDPSNLEGTCHFEQQFSESTIQLLKKRYEEKGWIIEVESWFDPDQPEDTISRGPHTQVRLKAPILVPTLVGAGA